MIAALHAAFGQFGSDAGHCGDTAVYNRATKKCIDITPTPVPPDPEFHTQTGDLLHDPGAGGWRHPSGAEQPTLLDEFACACVEANCSCGRKCDCLPPQRAAPEDGEYDQLACVCDRMLCNCNRECECTLQAQYDATPDSNG